MDENYLDSLLDEVSLDKELDNNIEDELDTQMANEKRMYQEKNAVSMDDLFNMDLDKDAGASSLDKDMLFSEDQLNELDQLDDLADLDMGDLDFDDIDFNDLDMTKIGDLDDGNIDNLLKDFEGDLQIADSFDGEEAIKEPVQEEILSDTAETVLNTDETMLQENLNEDSFDPDAFLNSLLTDDEPENTEQTISDLPNAESNISEIEHSAAENSVDTQPAEDNLALEHLMEDSPVESEAESEDELSLEELLEESLKFEAEYGEAMREESMPADIQREESMPTDIQQEESMPADIQQEESMPTDTLQQEADLAQSDASQDLETDVSESLDTDDTELPEMDSLEDLFSMLDLEDPEAPAEASNSADTADEPQMSDDNILGDILDNVGIEEEIPEEKEKKKKGFMEILFGEPDEDDELSEEELEAIEAKKAAKKAKKQAAKEAKKEKAEAAKSEKAFKDGQKKKENDEKKRVKAELKAKKKAEEKANAEPEKPLNRPAVIFIFSLFLGGTALFYLASNNFNYALAIENAAQFFSNQKYHNAYDEIKGVDVREEDQELKDRIYTVMYVERLYEGYENNRALGRQEKALDCLLRGVDKYYEHYEEAEKLGILSDLEYSFAQIRTALETQYGITVEQALAINDMENYDYVQTIAGYVQEEEVIQ